MAISNEQLFAFIRKNPIGVGCGIVSLGIVAALYFRGDKLPTAQEEVDQLTERRDRLAANVKNSAQLKEQLDEIQAANKTIQDRLVSARDVFGVPQYFQGLPEAAGTSIISQNPTGAAKAASKGGFVNVPFSIAVQGTFPQVLDFLRRLEYGEHYTRVLYTSVNKVPADIARESVVLTVNIEILGHL